MRGAHGLGVVDVFRQRIIPADAGSTWFRPSPGHDRWDHPRGCGEHIRVENNGVRDVGSSPRMRGALGEPHGRRLARRIIPADAGSTTNADRIATYD